MVTGHGSELKNWRRGCVGVVDLFSLKGVATIVTKLFNVVEPDVAVFGKKDYQQWRIIERMVRDLDFGIKIIGAELLRDPDGLAKSSRNVHPSPEQRKKKELTETLKAMSGEKKARTTKLKDLVIKTIHEAGGKVDYAEIVDQESLEVLEEIKSPAVFCIAVWFGNVRLLDNVEIAV
ncbi:hypothetical protein SASPL_137781 [Salvia splendens]|uniref:Pantoate--beta-alanine ligase n=1 Tax=Salvia splendens TaxID=180675 RepID=A0A8X8WVV0_SALSN|nr:hypothetical protein SASPL_137781 [Salvia splendens]